MLPQVVTKAVSRARLTSPEWKLSFSAQHRAIKSIFGPEKWRRARDDCVGLWIMQKQKWFPTKKSQQCGEVSCWGKTTVSTAKHRKTCQTSLIKHFTHFSLEFICNSILNSWSNRQRSSKLFFQQILWWAGSVKKLLIAGFVRRVYFWGCSRFFD